MTDSKGDSPVFEMEGSGISARAQVKGGQFTVLAGSEARVRGDAAFGGHALELQEGLLGDGALVPTDRPDIARLTRDVPFTTASEATSVLLRQHSMSSSGWFMRNEQGERVTYGLWKGEQPSKAGTLPTFELNSVGITARAEVRNGKFTVLQGSDARKEVVESFTRHVTPRYRVLRETLISGGELRPVTEGGHYKFTQDVEFTGSTPAAVVILGRNADGTTEWKRTLLDGSVQTHGAFLESLKRSDSKDPYTFAWLPFFRTLATTLLDLDLREALGAFERAAARMGEHKMQEVVGRFSSMDPVSGLSLAAWFRMWESRSKWIGIIAEEFHLDVPLPKTEADLRGLWSTGYLESIFLYQEPPEERQWTYDLTRQVLDRTLQPETLAEALTRKHFKLGKVTQFISALDPELYAPAALLQAAHRARPIKTAQDYWESVAAYRGQDRWPVELLERERDQLRSTSSRPAAGPPAGHPSRLEGVTDWLKTQKDNLAQNEREYKLAGAHAVRAKLEAFQARATEEKLNVHPQNLLNLLGWRTTGAFNMLVDRAPEAFRGALGRLWGEPTEALRADAFWEVLEPHVQALEVAERRALSGVGTRASIASYFLFVLDPTGHPFYRPSFGGASVEWLDPAQGPLDRRSPGHLLNDYVERCRTFLEVFQEADVPLQDLLDLQGPLYIISDQYPGGPGAGTGEPSDPIVREYQEFLAHPAQQLRCAVRRERAGQIRELLRGGPITLETFNREIWKYETQTRLDGQPITGELYAEELTAERAAELAQALREGRLDLHGNYTWGSGAAVFGAALQRPTEEKEELLWQASQVLQDASLTPLETAGRLLQLPGFGPNVATGLTMLHHPGEFALYNRRSADAMSALNYDVSSLEAFQASVQELKEKVGARDYLELDWFLCSRFSGTGFWWVNQGQTYAEESAGGYVWASTETGRTLAHHENVLKLKPGDRILHYANQAIQAIGTVTAPAVEVDDEIRSEAIPTKRNGYLAHVKYQALQQPIPLRSISLKWRQAKYGPFDKNGNVLQGYLFPLERAFLEEALTPEPGGQAAWLFQANPKYYDLAERVESAKEGDNDEWTVTRYHKEMKVGDPVVLWLSGREGGIYAVGELTGPAVPRQTPPEWRVKAGLDTPEDSFAVPFRFTHILSAPLPRAEIERHPLLSQMLVMRVPNGTNYKLSPQEWEALSLLLIDDEAWKEAIADVLKASDEGLHLSVITQQVMEGGRISTSQAPERSVSRVLAAFPGTFEALGAGVYRLKKEVVDPYVPTSFPAIREAVLQSGLRVDERTLRRYHLALQTRGFVILSGVSGTGKTWLAQEYARAAGARVQVFPVAPNWTSNEDLLGFFSPLEGGHYHHTAFSRFLLEAGEAYRAASQAGQPARPYHLVLDEMNLARVEYYFAQFLSKMELRARGHTAELDLGPGQKALLSPNVYVIGTVNVDETTHDFSDKVYDRAQVIEVPVTREQLAGHLMGHPQADLLMKLWDAVHPVAPFAFRVLDEVKEYQAAALALDVNALEALDDAVLQKVLPKLRGTDPRLLQALDEVLKITEGVLLLSYEKASRMRSAGAHHGFVTFH